MYSLGDWGNVISPHGLTLRSSEVETWPTTQKTWALGRSRIPRSILPITSATPSPPTLASGAARETWGEDTPALALRPVASPWWAARASGHKPGSPREALGHRLYCPGGGFQQPPLHRLISGPALLFSSCSFILYGVNQLRSPAAAALTASFLLEQHYLI